MPPADQNPKPAVLADPARRAAVQKSPVARQWKNRLFVWFCGVVASLSVLILFVLLGSIFGQGLERLSWDFLTSPVAAAAADSGIQTALVGTLLVCGVCGLVALPLGVATAVFLEEYRPRRRWLRKLRGFLQLNISNLAGVPSVVYGILGLTVFVNMFGLFGSSRAPAVEFGADYTYQFVNETPAVLRVPVDGFESPPPTLVEGLPAVTGRGREVALHVVGPDDEWPADPELATRTLRSDAEGGLLATRHWWHFRLPFGRSVLAMGLTLALLVLPILVTAAQEAIRAVPYSLREGAFGLGATRWQTIRQVTLPAAVPGVMTGSIIAMSRAVGEAAPIVVISGIVYMTNLPDSLMSNAPLMPVQIYFWSSDPGQDFHDLAASGIIVLLGVLLAFNAVAVVLRQKLQKPLS